MIPGETIIDSGVEQCADCGAALKLSVCKSAAGWYLGTMCYCGPYSRESDYYASEEEARADLARPAAHWCRR